MVMKAKTIKKGKNLSKGDLLTILEITIEIGTEIEIARGIPTIETPTTETGGIPTGLPAEMIKYIIENFQ